MSKGLKIILIKLFCIQKIKTCIFCRVEYIQLSLQYKPLNLGQGFPDFHAPESVRKALANITLGDNPLLNQYTRGFVST